jgi:hypothetical protein
LAEAFGRAFWALIVCGAKRTIAVIPMANEAKA